MIFSIFKCFGQISFYKCTFGSQYLIFGQFRGYGRLILQKYDVFNSIQLILIVFWGKAWLCLPPRSPDMNTRTGLAPRTLSVHLMNAMIPFFLNAHV